MAKPIKYSPQDQQQLEQASQAVSAVEKFVPLLLAKLKLALDAPLKDRQRFQLSFLAQSLQGVAETRQEVETFVSEVTNQIRIEALPPSPGVRSFCPVCGSHAIFMAGVCCPPKSEPTMLSAK